MMASIWALKGGRVTSTTTAMTAVGVSAGRPALMVDLCGDQTSLFRMGRHHEGIAEWSSGQHKAGELLHHAFHVTGTLRLLPAAGVREIPQGPRNCSTGSSAPTRSSQSSWTQGHSTLRQAGRTATTGCAALRPKLPGSRS